MAAWPMVQKPKHKGGLGVINLRIQNDALLMKQLHKFYIKADIPWVNLIWMRYYQNKVPHASREVGSFWWKDVLRLNVLYRGMARCTVGDGSTVLFWNDLWLDGIISHEFPRLYSFALNQQISVQMLMQADSLDDLFSLPLSEQAYQEYQLLQDKLVQIHYDDSIKDQWQFIWGNGLYTSRKLYGLAFNHLNAPPIFRWLWKSKCIPRLKFFAWLVFVDRLNTKIMLHRRNFTVQPNLFCVMCNDQVEEDIQHLFFDCPFAVLCWQKIGFGWQFDVDFHGTFQRTRAASQIPYFMEIFVIAIWEIRNIRNGKIFDGKGVSLNLWALKFKEQILRHLHRVREDNRQTIMQWLESVL